jgi:hypothetical protein
MRNIDGLSRLASSRSLQDTLGAFKAKSTFEYPGDGDDD